jgi:hypothetical protein
MNRLLLRPKQRGRVSQTRLGDNLNWLAWLCHPERVEGSLRFVDNCPNASVVELVEALKKFLKTSPMMASGVV